MSRAKRAPMVVLALAMMAMGVLHFAQSDSFVMMMPPWLPAPMALVLISGFFEFAGGLGLFLNSLRTLVDW